MKSLSQTNSFQTPAIDKLTSPTATLPTTADFRQRKGNELRVKESNLVSEFRERKNVMVEKSNGIVMEYELISKMAYVNSGKNTPEVILSIEQTIKSQWNSGTLADWNNELGFNKLTLLICEVLNYFFAAFKTKERIEGTELMRLATKIFTHDRHLKISDIVTVLDNAVKGLYGVSYNRVDEATFFIWLEIYKTQKTIALETEMVNNKPEQANPGRLVNPLEEELRIYETMQKRKKEIRDRVNES